MPPISEICTLETLEIHPIQKMSTNLFSSSIFSLMDKVIAQVDISEASNIKKSIFSVELLESSVVP